MKDFHLEEDNHLHTRQLYNNLIINEKQYHQKLLKLEKEFKEKDLHSCNEIDSLQTQLKILQKQFEDLTTEHLKSIEQINQYKNQSNENEQNLQDEIQRLRRDLGLELYRKQDAEKKVRSCEDKLRHEQTQLQKIQYDFTVTKHDLKTLQVKYDALQLELMEIKKNSSTIFNMPNIETIINHEQALIQTEQRITRNKRRTNDDNQTEQNVKKPKRITRSQSNASSNTISLNIHQENEKQIIDNSSNTIRIPVKQSKKNSSNVRNLLLFFCFVTTTNEGKFLSVDPAGFIEFSSQVYSSQIWRN